MTEQVNPFKVGDFVKPIPSAPFGLNSHDLPWRVKRIDGDLVKVERTIKNTNRHRTESYHYTFLMLSSGQIPKREFSEAQEIAIKEIVRKVVAEMDVEGFFNHDHEKGES
jgi:hypothetical protein